MKDTLEPMIEESRRPFVDQTVTVSFTPALEEEWRLLAKAVGSATAHEAAGRIGALPSAIKPVSASFRIVGRAFTVQSPPCDNLWIHRAIAAAHAGDVLVVNTSAFHEAGYWGEIMSTAAQCAQLAGLVIDGCVRDGALLAEIGFPVFARGLAIRGTGKDFSAPGGLNVSIWMGEVSVEPGDLMIGDLDGVVCIPRHRIAAVLQAARVREEKEAAILKRLQNGETTLQVYDLDK